MRVFVDTAAGLIKTDPYVRKKKGLCMNLSLCVVTRNDNYGKNLIRRASIALMTMLSIADEVIVVDFNSPRDSAPMLMHPRMRRIVNHPRLRHVIIDAASCQRITNVPCEDRFFETIARNEGIRRATGRFIASTNIEIVPPDNLRSVVEGHLSPTSVAIFRRLHVTDKTVRRNNLATCEGHSLSLHETDGAARLFDKISIIPGCGDMQIAHRDVWSAVSFSDKMMNRSYADTMLQASWFKRGYSFNVCQYVQHIRHSREASTSVPFLNRNLHFRYLNQQLTESEYGIP